MGAKARVRRHNVSGSLGICSGATAKSSVGSRLSRPQPSGDATASARATGRTRQSSCRHFTDPARVRSERASEERVDNCCPSVVVALPLPAISDAS